MDFAQLFSELEEHAELLIETCKQLKQENNFLHQQVSSLTQECSALKKRNVFIADQISNVIHQLKTVDRAGPTNKKEFSTEAPVKEVDAYEQ